MGAKDLFKYYVRDHPFSMELRENRKNNRPKTKNYITEEGKIRKCKMTLPAIKHRRVPPGGQKHGGRTRVGSIFEDKIFKRLEGGRLIEGGVYSRGAFIKKSL